MDPHMFNRRRFLAGTSTLIAGELASPQVVRSQTSSGSGEPAETPAKQVNMTTKGFGGRLPLVDVTKLDPAQKKMLDYLEASTFSWAKQSGFQYCLPDGRVIGPFNAFLHRPEMGLAFHTWVDAESAHTTLAPDVRQVVILTVGVAWHAAYEIYAHVAVARTAHVEEKTIEAILAGKQPDGASDAILAAWRFTDELVSKRSVSPGVYEAAKAIFGDRGLVDMVNLIGLYLFISALLNAFEVPAPG